MVRVLSVHYGLMEAVLAEVRNQEVGNGAVRVCCLGAVDTNFANVAHAEQCIYRVRLIGDDHHAAVALLNACHQFRFLCVLHVTRVYRQLLVLNLQISQPQQDFFLDRAGSASAGKPEIQNRCACNIAGTLHVPQIKFIGNSDTGLALHFGGSLGVGFGGQKVCRQVLSREVNSSQYVCRVIFEFTFVIFVKLYILFLTIGFVHSFSGHQSLHQEHQT